jgi:hypothetical protein
MKSSKKSQNLLVNEPKYLMFTNQNYSIIPKLKILSYVQIKIAR